MPTSDGERHVDCPGPPIWELPSEHTAPSPAAASARLAAPEVAFPERATLWLVREERGAVSWSVYKGPRDRVVVEAVLERTGGHLEIETAACGPVALSVEDLQALGVIS